MRTEIIVYIYRYGTYTSAAAGNCRLVETTPRGETECAPAADPSRGWEAFSKLFRYIKYSIHSAYIYIYICVQCPANGQPAVIERRADGWTYGEPIHIYIYILYVCGTNQSVSERDNIHTNVINDLQLTHWICTSSSIYTIYMYI